MPTYFFFGSFYLLDETKPKKKNQPMMTIKFDDGQQAINVPQSWSDIRLGDYEKWFDSEPQTRADEIQLIAQICGIDADILLNNPTQLFDVVSDTVRFIFDTNAGKASNEVEIEGKEYLIAFTDELTLAEWIDIESVFEKDRDSRLSQILSILCRPVGEIYDHKRSESRRQLFADLTMDKALPLLAFFLHQNELSETISSLYSQVEDRTAQYLHLIQDLATNGDGIKLLPIWQRIKYYYSIRFLKNRLSKFSDSYSIESTKLMPKRSKINFRGK